MTSEWAELMRHGRYEDAWRICDRETFARPADMSTRPRHLQTLWNGTPIVGRRVLIGDTLQFVRYLPAVQESAREVSLWVQPELIELLKAAGASVTTLPLHDGTPDVERDLDIEIMEFPHVFRTTVDTIPSRTPYLMLADRHEHHSGDAIGVIWRAVDWDRERSIPLDALAELLRVPGVRFLPLAYRPTTEERGLFDESCPTISDVLTLAKVIMSCRLVIAVDAMAAHLAGALNVPTWTLLKRECDWRWMVDRVDTPWYPSMRLYRQQTPGAWGPVLSQVSRDLRILVADAEADLFRRVQRRALSLTTPCDALGRVDKSKHLRSTGCFDLSAPAMSPALSRGATDSSSAAVRRTARRFARTRVPSTIREIREIRVP